MFNRLEAFGRAWGRPISPSLCRTALKDLLQTTKKLVRLSDIERAVCDEFGLDPRRLREGSKAKAVSQPRMLAMWLARKHTRAAFSEISAFFGRRSHSTVISAEKKVELWREDGTSLQLGDEACHVNDAIRRLELHL